ncbi:MAG: RnfABCDGE type electron transport complex subunit D [Candidatus Aenigmarchaeota archaeon]|nr:RnfABCDGE type electron transport complex subunit D [Candidatus Aenigmarchaeota archaeon]
MKLDLSVSPHIKTKSSSKKIMFTVIFALLFPSVAGIYYFGMSALWILITCIVCAQFTETVVLRMQKKDTKITGGAIITGLILGLIVPPNVPLWLCAIGSSFGIIIGKMVFGGSGSNIFNPALVGRAFMGAGWPALMSVFTDVQDVGAPLWKDIADATTTATPLVSKAGVDSATLFLGSHGGCIGETSILFILFGGLVLLIKRHIDWRIPACMIGAVFVLSAVSGTDPMYQILAGGLMFGAFFIATDYVTSPMTKRGRIVYAVVIGCLVFLMRNYGTMAEGVAYSILFMNAMVPLIDRFTQNRIFGDKV